MVKTEDRLPTWCADDGWCPRIAASVVLGRKWHPVIIHRLLEHDPLGFGILESRIQGISRKVLSESLADLEEKGLVERTVVNEKPVSVEYSLSPMAGRSQTPLMDFTSGGKTIYRRRQTLKSRSSNDMVVRDAYRRLVLANEAMSRNS